MKPSTMRDYDTMERLFLGHLLNLVHDVASDNNNDLSLSVSSDIVHDDCLPATQDNFVYLTLSGHPSLHAVAIQRSRNPITELFILPPLRTSKPPIPTTNRQLASSSSRCLVTTVQQRRSIPTTCVVKLAISANLSKTAVCSQHRVTPLTPPHRCTSHTILTSYPRTA